MTKRGLSLYIAVCVMFSCILYKIISLNYSSYAKAEGSYSSKTLLIGQSRGNIYDINMKRLVNGTEKYVCAAKPGAYSLSYLNSIDDEEKKNSLISQLTKGQPVVFESDKALKNEDIESFSVRERYDESDFLCHVIGYTDSASHGVTGIEKAFDDFLSEESGSLSVTFETDANGRVLSGIVPTVSDNNFNSCAGVILTVDAEIQKIAERAMKNSQIKSGACVILSAQDAGISAMVSTPSFSRSELSKAVESKNSPLVNKCLSAYAVGSVFKPVIACAALENGVNTDFGYECDGVTEIGSQKYCCNNKTSHGKVNLRGALEASCNTYFIELTKKLKSEKLYDFCTSLGFSSGAYLCEGIYSDDGIFPEKEELENAGQKANVSFGQGNLTATPVQLAAAYLAIADGGYYKYPYLVKGKMNSDGSVQEFSKKPDSRVISEKTCKTVKEDLISVVKNGNAYNAECALCTVAGKTGTAQSGSYDELGNEILRTWFVGFFPANEPRYAVSVLCENGKSGASDCAPVFKEIAENIMELLIERANGAKN